MSVNCPQSLKQLEATSRRISDFQEESESMMGDETKRWKQSLLGRSNQRLNSKTKNPHFHASYAIMKTRGKEKTISRRKTTSRAAPSSNSPVNSTIAPLYRQEIVRKHKSKFFRSVLATLTCNLSIVFSRDFLRAQKKKIKKNVK